MPFVVIRTAEAVKAGMITQAQADYLDATGETWDALPLDPQTLSFGVVGQGVHEAEVKFNDAGNAALPGPTSPHLDAWVATSGLTRMTDESNVELWERYIAFRQQGDGTTEPGLRQLALLGDSRVADIGFTVQSDLSVNVYLISNEPPPAFFSGVASTALNTAVGLILNNVNTKGLVSQFNVVAATVTPVRVDATIHYDSSVENLQVLQNAVSAAMIAYMLEARTFVNKKPCKGNFLDAGVMSKQLLIPGVRRVSEYGFKRASDANILQYIEGGNNGFFTFDGRVLIDEAAPLANRINLAFTDMP